MHRGPRALLSLVLLGGCADELELPPVVASSKYIDYHADLDPAQQLCLDGLLARADRFIERTAATLGVAAPTGRIHYVLDTAGADAPWACESSLACYRYRDDGDGLIVANAYMNNHELVHAVEIPALGEYGSRILGEGLAEFLGSDRVDARADVSTAFAAALADPDGDLDYGLAMRFVGALFTTYGAAEYRTLRATMPRDADADEFAAVFESIYDLPLADALAAMTAPVFATDLPAGCADGDAEPLTWTAPGLLATTLVSACGDVSFHFGVHDPTRPSQRSLHALYTLDVVEPGYYDFTVGRADATPGPVYGALRPCAVGKTRGQGSLDGRTGHALLEPGKFVISVDFPDQPTLAGEATLRLEYIGPPPP